MIADTAKVLTSEGITAAMDLPLGATLITRVKHPYSSKIVRKDVRMCPNPITLVLASGRKFCGSPDQRVYEYGRLRPTRLDNVRIGMKLEGDENGNPVTIMVIGMLFSPQREVRVVDIVTDHKRPYVVEGLLCHS